MRIVDSPVPGVDDVAVGRRDRQRADRAGGEETVGHVLPVLAGIVALPHAAGDRAEVEDRLTLGIGGDGHHPTATGRPDAAVSDLTEELRINCRHAGIFSPQRPGLVSCGT